MSDLSSVEVSISPVEKFREYLATQKMRLTLEREIIVKEVFSDHEHFDAEELTARLASRGTGPHVSRATVYRALREMVNAGLLRKVARPNDREVYEHDYGYPQHDHFICKSCGSLTEFKNDSISEILEQVAARHGFRLEGHRLEAYGLCNACSQPPRSRHRKLDLL